MMGLPNRAPRTDLEKLVFLCRWRLRLILGWALAMRTIKCL